MELVIGAMKMRADVNAIKMLQKIDVPISQMLHMNYNVAISPGWRHTVHNARWVRKISFQKTAQINGWDPDSDKMKEASNTLKMIWDSLKSNADKNSVCL